MKDRLTGILIGVAACAAIVVVSGFSFGNEEIEANDPGRYQLVQSISDYHNDGVPRVTHLILLDTEKGDVWEYESLTMSPFDDSTTSKEIDRQEYPSRNFFVKLYVD